MLVSPARTFASPRTLARIAAVGSFAALSAISARVTINLPFTPVPVTLQVLVVLLAGLVLGPRGGAHLRQPGRLARAGNIRPIPTALWPISPACATTRATSWA